MCRVPTGRSTRVLIRTTPVPGTAEDEKDNRGRGVTEGEGKVDTDVSRLCRNRCVLTSKKQRSFLKLGLTKGDKPNQLSHPNQPLLRFPGLRLESFDG